MNRSILALLIAVVLIFTTGASQASSGRTFNAWGKFAALHKQVLPRMVEQTESRQRSARGLSTSKLDDVSQSTLFELAASTVLSWTLKTFDTTPFQENCLTTAVYFEARSESQLGQLAVATVVLNRVKASNSNSICAVVYKGARNFNACQFSFACDGKADLVDDARAWKAAVEVTAIALADDKNIECGPMHILADATNYHADYVNPEWSKSLNRLTKIGRHIFYSQS